MDTSILQPLGDYPESWVHMVFDQFSTLKRGKDLTRDQFHGGSVPVAGSNGVIGFHDTANVKAPGITVGRSGSVGRVTFFTQDFWAHNTTLFVANLHGNDARFAAYFLNFLKLGRFGSGASIPTLDRNSFRLMPVIVPPLTEQWKIAGVLGMVQRAMEQQEQLLQLTAELKKTLLHHLFSQGLLGESQKQTEIGPVPDSWEVKRFDDFSTLQRGKDLTKTEFRKGTIPVAGSNGIIGYHDTASVHGPGVTVGRSGSVGKVIFYPTDFWAHNTSLYVRDFHGNEPLFVAYYLKHLRLDRFRSGASVPTLDRNQFKEILVAVPLLDEQKEIARVLSTLDRKVHFIELKRNALTEIFRTLLHRLMTAQIRVQNLELQDLV